MNYRTIKELKEKNYFDIEQLKHINQDKIKNKDISFKINETINEKKKRYNFYNNLLKEMSKGSSNG